MKWRLARIVRLAVANVPTTCGPVSLKQTEEIQISSGHFFNQIKPGPGVQVFGDFLAGRRAAGGLRLASGGYLPCASDEVAWSASTPRDTAPPKTSIRSGPSGTTKSHQATFKLKSNESGSTFQCMLDGKGWKRCRSPKSYKNLKEGRHTFRARARDGAGNVDTTPAKRTWHVEPRG
jgi:hypothetical protein